MDAPSLFESSDAKICPRMSALSSLELGDRKEGASPTNYSLDDATVDNFFLKEVFRRKWGLTSGLSICKPTQTIEARIYCILIKKYGPAPKARAFPKLAFQSASLIVSSMLSKPGEGKNILILSCATKSPMSINNPSSTTCRAKNLAVSPRFVDQNLVLGTFLTWKLYLMPRRLRIKETAHFNLRHPNAGQVNAAPGALSICQSVDSGFGV